MDHKMYHKQHAPPIQATMDHSNAIVYTRAMQSYAQGQCTRIHTGNALVNIRAMQSYTHGQYNRVHTGNALVYTRAMHSYTSRRDYTSNSFVIFLLHVEYTIAVPGAKKGTAI